MNRLVNIVVEYCLLKMARVECFIQRDHVELKNPRTGATRCAYCRKVL